MEIWLKPYLLIALLSLVIIFNYYHYQSLTVRAAYFQLKIMTTDYLFTHDICLIKIASNLIRFVFPSTTNHKNVFYKYLIVAPCASFGFIGTHYGSLCFSLPHYGLLWLILDQFILLWISVAHCGLPCLVVTY